MNKKLHFLGTGCMVPTKERNHLSIALEFDGNIFLFDCGEATQNQIKNMKLPIGKIKKIFISHWHGDHVLGLPGLIQTLSNTEGIKKIEIHGPIDSKKYMNSILTCSIFDSKVPIETFEHDPKENEILNITNNKQYKIDCVKLNHSVPCIGFSFKEKDTLNIDEEKIKKLGIKPSPLLARAKLGIDIEINNKKIKSQDITYKKKGTKITFIFDTRPTSNINLIAKDSDYLVMEATYLYKTHSEKAEEYDHMSAKETAEIARENNVKNLIITHFSQRYKEAEILLDEAKEEFENTTLTYDLMTLKLK